MFTAFIVTLVLLVYAWILYPVGMLWRGRGAVCSRQSAVGADLPHVAILFSAHNEEAVILKRLENLAALDYPPDKIQIYAGIDGGSDRTAEIALAWAQSHPNVHVVVSEMNHGKTAMLKRLVKAVEEGRIRTSNIEHSTLSIERGGEKQANTPHLNPLPQGERKDESLLPLHLLPLPLGERAGVRVGLERAGVRGSSSLNVQRSLLVFTDANTFFAPDALRNLVAPFDDLKVGGVCGRLNFVRGEKGRTSNIERGGDEQANTPHLNPLPQGERKDENLLPLPLG
jgi:cellulose synthase/poly-beta-1,6-N-acetylglucosamine synthase-like glycosyltransferase